MAYKHKPTFVEKIAESIGLIPNLHKDEEYDPSVNRLTEPGDLTKFPPPEQWDEWTEYEAKSWPKKEKKTYSIVKNTLTR